MANYKIYFSPTGGTKKVTDLLAKAMGPVWQEIDLCRAVSPTALTAEDVCLVSVPSYGGRVPKIAVERLRAITAGGAKAVLVCVYGNRAWEDTLTELQDTLENCGFVCAAAVAAVAEHSIFRRYAAGRPDGDDAAELAGFAARIQAKLKSGVFGTLVLEGSHGNYKEYGAVSLQPEGDERCVSCGLCAGGCPVEAIPPENPCQTNKELCIGCMRCVVLCPEHARDFDPVKMDAAAASKESKLGGHKNNYLYL